MKIKEIKYEEFYELVNFLSTDNNILLLERISRFLPDLTSLQEFEMNYLCNELLINKENGEALFKNFIKKYPDLEFHEDGKGIPKRKSYWEIQLESLDTCFNAAFSNLKSSNFIDKSINKVDSQIYNARELSCLKNIKDTYNITNYIFEREILLKKDLEVSNYLRNNLKNIEKIIFNITGNYIILYKILIYVKNKNFKKCKIFLNHLFQRIELLEKDKDLTAKSNKDFLENIKKIEA